MHPSPRPVQKAGARASRMTRRSSRSCRTYTCAQAPARWEYSAKTVIRQEARVPPGKNRHTLHQCVNSDTYRGDTHTPSVARAWRRDEPLRVLRLVRDASYSQWGGGRPGPGALDASCFSLLPLPWEASHTCFGYDCDHGPYAFTFSFSPTHEAPCYLPSRRRRLRPAFPPVFLPARNREGAYVSTYRGSCKIPGGAG